MTLTLGVSRPLDGASHNDSLVLRAQLKICAKTTRNYVVYKLIHGKKLCCLQIDSWKEILLFTNLFMEIKLFTTHKFADNLKSLSAHV